GILLADVEMAAVYSSPLRRAIETARPIAQSRGLAVEPVDELTEVDVGQWEGLPWDEIQRTDPEGYRLFMDDASVHPYRGGEHLEDVARRVVPAFERLAGAHPGERIAVVAHNIVNRCILARLMDVPLAQYRFIPQDNCGVNLLRWRNGRLKAVTVNAVLHLHNQDG
ncbi:MAG: histidine phosphatase family protein, partial [Pirellulales bacterium]|nr:histidine phosphatase family protein [Pirellulales bacterium]